MDWPHAALSEATGDSLRVQAYLVSKLAFCPLKQKNLMPQKWAATF